MSGTVINKKVVATVGPVEGAGVLVWWERHGDVSVPDIRAALGRANLDPARWGPSDPSLEQALASAVRQHCGERKKHGVIAVRRAGAWYLVAAKVAQAGDDLDTLAFARLRLATIPEATREDGSVTPEPWKRRNK